MNAEVTSFVVSAEKAGERLDTAVAALLDISRSMAAKLIENGEVTVGGAGAEKNYRLREGDKILCRVPEPSECRAEAEDIPLDIVYEDEYLIVVNKPKGMVVHPAAGVTGGTLVNALLAHCGDSLSGIGGVARPGIVHRLDKDTSGLIVAAKNDRTHIFLQQQWKNYKAQRRYEAVLVGIPRDDVGEIDLPIGRSTTDRKKMAVVADGREAQTAYRVIERFTGFSHVSLTLRTGRTHQIRVHMSHTGHPVLGDTVYGGDRSDFAKHNAALLRGQCLHARTLGFVHPLNGKEMLFDCGLPDYFETILGKLRKI